MPARAWWYDESDDSRKYAAAAHRSRGSRGRRSWVTVLVVLAFLGAVVAFSWLHPKTTCSQTVERRSDGLVIVHTQCRETHSFP